MGHYGSVLIGYIKIPNSNKNTNINAFLFVDDVVLIADCPIKLQYLLDALGKWCKDNQMMIKHDKTKTRHTHSA